MTNLDHKVLELLNSLQSTVHVLYASLELQSFNLSPSLLVQPPSPERRKLKKLQNHPGQFCKVIDFIKATYMPRASELWEGLGDKSPLWESQKCLKLRFRFPDAGSIDGRE